jgi:putative PIN family toxin of toxin-antitoxin system
MRVVLDTNVVISGLFFGGIPRSILTGWSDERFQLILTVEILQEYERVARELDRKYQALEADWEQVLRLIAQNATFVSVQPLKKQVCADPGDDKFLACARASAPSLIVSGDKHLLDVSGWNEIEVLTPRQFHSRQLRDG